MDKHTMPFIGKCSKGYLGVVFSWGAVKYAEGNVAEAYRGFHLIPFDTTGEPVPWSSTDPEVIISAEHLGDM